MEKDIVYRKISARRFIIGFFHIISFILLAGNLILAARYAKILNIGEIEGTYHQYAYLTIPFLFYFFNSKLAKSANKYYKKYIVTPYINEHFNDFSFDTEKFIITDKKILKMVCPEYEYEEGCDLVTSNVAGSTFMYSENKVSYDQMLQVGEEGQVREVNRVDLLNENVFKVVLENDLKCESIVCTNNLNVDYNDEFERIKTNDEFYKFFRFFKPLGKKDDIIKNEQMLSNIYKFREQHNKFFIYLNNKEVTLFVDSKKKLFKSNYGNIKKRHPKRIEKDVKIIELATYKIKALTNDNFTFDQYDKLKAEYKEKYNITKRNRLL